MLLASQNVRDAAATAAGIVHWAEGVLVLSTR